MASDQAEYSDGETSRSRTPRRGHRSRRHHADDESIDSGYGGSSPPRSPHVPYRRLSKGRHASSSPHSRRDKHKHSHDGAKKSKDSLADAESDSDYDPKSKYYIKVDDDEYRDMSFQRASDENSPGEIPTSKSEGKRRESVDSHSTRESRSSHSRHRRSLVRDRSYSKASSDSETSTSRKHGDRRHSGSRRSQDATRLRQGSYWSGQLSPVPSVSSDEWQTSPERSGRSITGSRSRSIDQRKKSSILGSGSEESDSDVDRRRRDRSRRRRSASRMSASPDKSRKVGGTSASSQYKGAADMDDAWYKTFKERLTKGVDLNQVKKVGLDAAAVAAVKVAVGTQIPWKQRIPKTIAVGLAAAVTDFLVSKTSFKPKGMVGTMYARQLVEIVLANMIINPVSNKVTGAAQNTKGKGQSSGSASKLSAGGAGRRR